MERGINSLKRRKINLSNLYVGLFNDETIILASTPLFVYFYEAIGTRDTLSSKFVLMLIGKFSWSKTPLLFHDSINLDILVLREQVGSTSNFSYYNSLYNSFFTLCGFVHNYLSLYHNSFITLLGRLLKTSALEKLHLQFYPKKAIPTVIQDGDLLSTTGELTMTVRYIKINKPSFSNIQNVHALDSHCISIFFLALVK